MSPDRDSRFPPGDEPDDEFEEEEPRRSIFAAAWFRVVLVLLGVAVVGAVAVPYVLDVVNAPSDSPGTRTAVAPQSAPKPTSAAPSAPSAPARQSTPPAPTTQASPPPPVPAPATKSATPPEGAGARTSAPSTPAAKAPDKAPVAVAEAPKPKPTPAPAAPAKKDPVAEAPKREPAPTRAKPSEGGDYFVQVGAFKDQETAKKVAARLRDQNYPVDESVKRVGGALSAAPRPAPSPRTAAPSGPDRYDVIVSGGSAADINTKLAAKGLASEPAGDGVRIRPSLPLRDAVALSKDLGSEGFKVQVRRGGGGSASAEPPPAATGADTGGQTLYRVRVGGYPDRAAALAVQRELQEKGYQPFVAKGRE